MTKRRLLVATLAAGLTLPTVASALDFHIELGDRAYYTHGARYWDGDWEYIWVPGHRWHGRWIHGHYRRSEHRRHHGWDRRHDERHGDRY